MSYCFNMVFKFVGERTISDGRNIADCEMPGNPDLFRLPRLFLPKDIDKGEYFRLVITESGEKQFINDVEEPNNEQVSEEGHFDAEI